MENYLIEFRFQGKSKREIKKLIWEVRKKFSIISKRPIPHITIISPFSTSNERRLIKNFKEICTKFNTVYFKVKGYGCFDKSRVIHINIMPSKELLKFREFLLKRLGDYCKLNSTDISYFLGIFKKINKYSPHATIARNVNANKFEKIKRYIHKKKG